MRDRQGRHGLLKEIQHFGITVTKPLDTLRFYNDTLMFPFVSVNFVQGRSFERMYQLERVKSFIAWYQFPASAMELFYLPWQPPANTKPGDILKPGYRYAGYRVEGLDDYIARLESRRIGYRVARHGGTRALLVADPTGINNILFEQKSVSGRSVGTGIEEAGLTVSDPVAYEQYYDLIGLTRRDEPDDGMESVIQELFRIDQPVKTIKYGHIRLLHFPESATASTRKFFPDEGGDNVHAFNDSGLRHVAYIVEDAQAFYEKARANGVRFIFEPMLVPGGSLISYFLDPEGNTLEVVQPDPRADKISKFIGSVYSEQLALLARARRMITKFRF